MSTTTFDDDSSTTYYGDNTGSTPYDAGVTNSTGPTTTAPPDGSGGGGSYLSSLLPTLTGGLNAILAANLNDKFGQGIASGLATVDQNGNLTYKATPAQQPAAGAIAVSQALSSPVLIFGVVAVIVAILVLSRK